ncbi:DNA damage-inducible protein 1 [Actinomortierella ambigua]|uniref:DNA damage-inducible protein 1 n=1 Tax=Actinomortierella ambigua TaxID=1343610 RepID=A0A9P6QED2_9FUNG|nr:DNA damage-inducible protein 1 [Actinomortierella ambigua]
MRVSVLTESGDLHHLEFDSQMELENIKALLEADTGVPADDQRLFYNTIELVDPKATLQTYSVNQDDIIELRRNSTLTRAARRPNAAPAAAAAAAAAGARIPPAAGGVHPGQISQGGGNAHDAEQIRQHVLSDPALLAQLRERQPHLAEAAINNPSRFHTMIRELDVQRRDAEQQRMMEIQTLNENPFDLDAQQRIEEAIRLENVAANLEAALEYNPESFGRVTMLYIEVEVNGHPVKAFVDSGAQATIMSPQCAEACGIMRLVDKRFAGVARGVGVAKILGRVHSAQIRVGRDLFLACSFTIMEGKDVDLLFGLDMLKRHQACIDLRKNALVINDTEIPFLSEHELPQNAKVQGELTPEELAQIGGSVPHTSGSGSAPAAAGSGSGAASSSSSSSTPAPTPSPASTTSVAAPIASTPAVAASTTTPAAALTASSARPSGGRPAQSTAHSNEKIETLMALGFSRDRVIAALDAAGGNVDLAAGFLF